MGNKRTMLFLVAVILCSLLFVGCGAEKKENNETAAQTAPTLAEQETATEETQDSNADPTTAKQPDKTQPETDETETTEAFTSIDPTENVQTVSEEDEGPSNPEDSIGWA